MGRLDSDNQSEENHTKKKCFCAGTEKFCEAGVPLSGSCPPQAKIFKGFASLICQRSNFIIEFSYGNILMMPELILRI